ncbi:MAG TPA: UDP-glucuronic acid decarboxylase family protein [Acidimicrobiales bacterium]|jgi:dTDP-glucose 4,6-dehydratase|nr:UDP-glucuronic acid decarboxylase family protein [Acidimicrobiales bacterium]
MSRVVVAGGAGFLGSHFCEALVERGDEVVCVDNLSSGSEDNLGELAGSASFDFVKADITEGLTVEGPIDAVANLASPASPPEYLRFPLETLAVGSRGTEACLELAKAHDARFLMASTSEVYGDPLVHPQPESYWGNVNSIGPRSVYDESKRFAEALTMAYHRSHGLNVGIVRIFNTYGPRLRSSDGRVVSNFISQALAGKPLTIYGDGSQTRSFCYVTDLVRGLVAALDSDATGPINLGNPGEFTMTELAELVLEITGSDCPIVAEPLPLDDPTRRRPDTALAKELLGWEPEIALRDGLARTIEWFRSRSDCNSPQLSPTASR